MRLVDLGYFEIVDVMPDEVQGVGQGEFNEMGNVKILGGIFVAKTIDSGKSPPSP